MNSIVGFRLCTLSDDDLLEKVDRLTDEMFQGQKVPTRHIPAQPNNDYDLLVGELIKRFMDMKKQGTITITEWVPVTETKEP